MENINGQIHSSEGNAFYDYTRPGLAHADLPLTFETGGENPLPPTGDTIGGDNDGGTTHPLQLVKINSTTIAIRRGTVNTEVVKLGAVDLDVDYTLNTISVTGETVWYLVLTVDASGAVTNATIQDTDGGAVSSTNYWVEIGSVAWENGAIKGDPNSNLTGSQSHASCGSAHWMEQSM